VNDFFFGFCTAEQSEKRTDTIAKK
jgi:hypothetical protein